MYSRVSKDIVERIMDLSGGYGPVELALTGDTEGGDFASSVILRRAPEAVIRELVLDERVMDLSLEDGALIVIPAADDLFYPPQAPDP